MARCSNILFISREVKGLNLIFRKINHLFLFISIWTWVRARCAQGCGLGQTKLGMGMIQVGSDQRDVGSALDYRAKLHTDSISWGSKQTS